MHELSTDIEIDAPPELVWEVLTDFEAYPRWNPVMRITGRTNLGARLCVEMRLPGRSPLRFNPTVTKIDRGRELGWRGRLLVPGLYDGEHRFVIEPNEDGRTRFTQAETFEGVLVGPINRIYGRSTERAFREMNEALKERAEELEREGRDPETSLV